MCQASLLTNISKPLRLFWIGELVQRVGDGWSLPGIEPGARLRGKLTLRTLVHPLDGDGRCSVLERSGNKPEVVVVSF